MRWLRKYWYLPRGRKLLLLEALPAVILASVLLRVLDFSVIARWLGSTEQRPGEGLPKAAQPLGAEIGWAVRVAARRVPWPALCLVQALAATLLTRLHRLPTVLYLGVARGEAGELQAHAWLRCGDSIITGEASHERFQVVARFSA